MSDTKFCRSCGHEVSEQTKFCRNCGSEISSRHTEKTVQAKASEPRTEAKVPAAAQTPSPKTGGRQLVPLPVLIGVGIVVVAAVVSYFVFSGGSSFFSGDSTAGDRGGETIDTSVSGEKSEVDPGKGMRNEGEGPTPREIEEIEDLIANWHQAADDGDNDTMWRLLSNRKRNQILDNEWGAPDSSGSLEANYPDGRASWETAQESFQGNLDPSDVKVSVRNPSYPQEDVVTIEVRNMFKGSCPWEGITWVKRERGKWFYEPGYLVSPTRADDWRYINDTKEGLGERCSG